MQSESKLLVEKDNFVQLSTGDLLRSETSNSDSDLGKKVKYLMESGELVPDDIVIDIIINKVEEHKNKSIMIAYHVTVLSKNIKNLKASKCGQVKAL